MSNLIFVLGLISTSAFLIYAIYHYYYEKQQDGLHLIVISSSLSIVSIITLLIRGEDAYDIPLTAIVISLGIMFIYLFIEFYLAKRNGTLEKLISKNSMPTPLTGKFVLFFLAIWATFPTILTALFCLVGMLAKKPFTQGFEQGIYFTYLMFYILVEAICMGLPAYLCQRFVKEKS